jgi:hypothetical protein
VSLSIAGAWRWGYTGEQAETSAGGVRWPTKHEFSSPIVTGLTAFHGRGFFAVVFQPGDLQAEVVVIEAFIGLLIEIVLIATVSQRFSAR